MSFKLFFRTIIISGIVGILSIIVLVFSIFGKTNTLESIQEREVQSLLLTYELRQSSDDLTRLARTYAVTGNADYERMYWDIIKIRNGEIPRPLNYNRIYWDFVIDYKDKPIDKGRQVSLTQLMKEAGFTEKEFKLLEEAKNNSDELIKIETIAMNAVKGLFADKQGDFRLKKEPNRQMAIDLVHSKKYHTEKAKIMKPINEFMEMLEKRTNKEVQDILKDIKLRVIILMVVLVVILIFYTVLFYINRDKVKNLHLFKNELINFFKYINKEVEYAGTIKIKETGELKEMVDIVNENIIKTKNNIEQDTELIADVSRVVEQVKNGYLDDRVKKSTQNEVLQTLQKQVNDMLDNLEINIGKNTNVILDILSQYRQLNFKKNIKNAQGKVEIAINDLSKIINEMLLENKNHGEILKNSSARLLKNIDVLNTNTNSTAAALEETAAALEEINANANQNLDSVLKMSDNTSVLTQVTNKGKDLALQTSQAMENINEQVTSINEAISVIDQIAFQTNILSLNAAVEAATAGEAGKGFAVVAQEVRNLATRSAEAAKEIKDIVELASSKANDGQNIAGIMVNNYNDLNENILTNIKTIKDVENANKEQGRGIEQINDSVNSLDKRTQENASIASQTYDIAMQTDDVSKQIEESAKKVSF
ncbi:MAG: chemotaxis protein [Arcobacter sp.]|nr:MAG: chemotaxis protein [Arcobacter sp.]